MEPKDKDERSNGGGGGGGGGDGISFIEGVDEFLSYLFDAAPPLEEAEPSREDGAAGAYHASGGNDGGDRLKERFDETEMMKQANRHEFLSYLFDAAPPRDVELGAFAESPSSPPSSTQTPSSSSPTFVLLDEENNGTPTPPGMTAASFVREKAYITKDGDTAPIAEDQIAASVEGRSDEEDDRGKVKDYEVSRPPELERIDDDQIPLCHGVRLRLVPIGKDAVLTDATNDSETHSGAELASPTGVSDSTTNIHTPPSFSTPVDSVAMAVALDQYPDKTTTVAHVAQVQQGQHRFSTQDAQPVMAAKKAAVPEKTPQRQFVRRTKVTEGHSSAENKETFPRWRFVRKAKKSEGYSSEAAGATVIGIGAKLLGADYVAPIIDEEMGVKRYEAKTVGKIGDIGGDDVEETFEWGGNQGDEFEWNDEEPIVDKKKKSEGYSSEAAWATVRGISAHVIDEMGVKRYEAKTVEKIDDIRGDDVEETFEWGGNQGDEFEWNDEEPIVDKKVYGAPCSRYENKVYRKMEEPFVGVTVVAENNVEKDDGINGDEVEKSEKRSVMREKYKDVGVGTEMAAGEGDDDGDSLRASHTPMMTIGLEDLDQIVTESESEEASKTEPVVVERESKMCRWALALLPLMLVLIVTLFVSLWVISDNDNSGLRAAGALDLNGTNSTTSQPSTKMPVTAPAAIVPLRAPQSSPMPSNQTTASTTPSETTTQTRSPSTPESISGSTTLAASLQSTQPMATPQTIDSPAAETTSSFVALFSASPSHRDEPSDMPTPKPSRSQPASSSEPTSFSSSREPTLTQATINSLAAGTTASLKAHPSASPSPRDEMSDMPTPRPSKSSTAFLLSSKPTFFSSVQPTPKPVASPPENPTPASPMTGSPTTESPTTTSKATKSPTAASPTSAISMPASPMTVNPTTESLNTEHPTIRLWTVSPTTKISTNASPTIASPSTASLTNENPTTESPTTASTSSSPTTASPTTKSPKTASPSSSPTTASPTTKSPTTASPSSSPTTASPTTKSPTTASPSSSPTTASPTTKSPTTASPFSSPTYFPTFSKSPTATSPFSFSITPTPQCALDCNDPTKPWCYGGNCVACNTELDPFCFCDESPTGAQCQKCTTGEVNVEVKIQLDYWPSETTWTLTNLCGLPANMSGGPYSDQFKLITAMQCLPTGEYNFTIYDSNGDGFMQGFHPGYYTVRARAVDFEFKVTGDGDIGYNESQKFGSCPSPTFSPSPSIWNQPTSSPSTVPSIWNQQGPAIVGDADEDELGTSVALSADAKTLVVGAPGTNWVSAQKMGYVKIYRADEDGGDRVQLGETIYGDAVGDAFGWSVDISRDGNTLIIGSPGYYYSNDRPGYVRVFSLELSDDLDTSSWKQIGDDIVGEAIGDEFGYSVSLSKDGKTIAVGARGNNENGDDSSHVRVYRLDDSGSSWTQLGEDIDGEAAGDSSGWSVSLSADGKTVAIGAPWAGQVRVYRIDSEGSSWELLGETIYGDDENDNFGRSVDISRDGNTLIIGSPGPEYYDRPGYVRVFSLESSDDLDTGSWKQIGNDIVGEAIGDGCGYSVSLSEDGKMIAVGALYNFGNGDYSGHVRVYRLDDSGSSWTQLGEDIDGAAAGDLSGTSVSLSADGKTVAIGSSWNLDNGAYTGHVRVFVME